MHGTPMHPGSRAGKLVALSFLRTDRNGKSVWLWRCDCGREVERITQEARKAGRCGRCHVRPGRKAEDLSGRHFGRWTVLGRAENAGLHAGWLCLCDPERGGCGTKAVVRSQHLVSRRSRSCKACARPLRTDGDRVRLARLRRRLTIREAAALAGVSMSGWKNWERRKRLRPKTLATALSTLEGTT